MTKQPTRKELISAITSLMRKATWRHLYLMWVFTTHMMGCPEDELRANKE